MCNLFDKVCILIYIYCRTDTIQHNVNSMRRISSNISTYNNPVKKSFNKIQDETLFTENEGTGLIIDESSSCCDEDDKDGLYTGADVSPTDLSVEPQPCSWICRGLRATERRMKVAGKRSAHVSSILQLFQFFQLYVHLTVAPFRSTRLGTTH